MLRARQGNLGAPLILLWMDQGFITTADSILVKAVFCEVVSWQTSPNTDGSRTGQPDCWHNSPPTKRGEIDRQTGGFPDHDRGDGVQHLKTSTKGVATPSRTFLQSPAPALLILFSTHE